MLDFALDKLYYSGLLCSGSFRGHRKKRKEIELVHRGGDHMKRNCDWVESKKAGAEYVCPAL